MSEAILKILWKASPSSGGCWTIRCKSRYPHVRYMGAARRANRVVYKEFYGKDPGLLYVCHKCDNTKCVNPAHLFLGTQKENVEDMVNKGRLNSFNRNRTHCSHGHEYTKENTLIVDRGGKTNRHCRACHRTRMMRRYYRLTSSERNIP